ncbi:MAG: transporter permease [Myxococcaceae bacterium]|nr:transporter permease [Myxococcaceae bacterium]
MIDLLLEVFEGVARHRMRAAATAFGVFWGILMLVVLLGGGRGLRNGLDKLFADTATNSAWISVGRTSMGFEGLGPGRQLGLTIDDVEAVAQSVPELANVAPRHSAPSGLTFTRGTRNGAFPTYGIYPGYAVVERTQVVRGRLINDLDVARARRVVILGVRVVEALFGSGEAVGQRIEIGGVPFLVVGTFTDAGGEGELRRVFMPYTALAQTFDARRQVNVMTATLRPGASPERATAHLRRLFARRKRFDPNDRGAVDVWFAEQEYRKFVTLMRGIDLAVIVVGLGSLVSGMVGISNIMFVSVRERTAEFGLRRALGATPATVMAMVLAEAVALALGAGGLGLLVGVGLVEAARRAGVKSDYFRDPSIDLGTALTALGVLVATAVVAGYFPAREAARLNPNEALRST